MRWTGAGNPIGLDYGYANQDHALLLQPLGVLSRQRQVIRA
jgi:hypothetical protein